MRLCRKRSRTNIISARLCRAATPLHIFYCLGFCIFWAHIVDYAKMCFDYRSTPWVSAIAQHGGFRLSLNTAVSAIAQHGGFLI